MSNEERGVPAGHPGSQGGPFVAGEPGAPVVEAARRGVRRANLGHGESDEHGEDPSKKPTEGHGDGAAEPEAGVVQRGDPGENRYDGEGEGKVRQNPNISAGTKTSIKVALELLLVTEFVEPRMPGIHSSGRIVDVNPGGSASGGLIPLPHHLSLSTTTLIHPQATFIATDHGISDDHCDLTTHTLRNESPPTEEAEEEIGNPSATGSRKTNGTRLLSASDGLGIRRPTLTDGECYL
ncbi:hypothetical protein GW17_00020942 [Ensete ventricosum]|nr:hypothetical protein GW17_00020942 [Ensete ventricosum]